MTLSDLAALGSLISGLAVLVSLVYLALQVRQTERNQQAAIQQAANHMSINIWMSRALNPAIRDASRAAYMRPQDLKIEEWEQVLFLHVAMFRLYQDDFRHHKQGLLSDAAFASRTHAFRGSMAFPFDRATWNSVKGAYDPDFVEAVDKIVAETPIRVPDRPAQLAQWQADVVAMIAEAKGNA